MAVIQHYAKPLANIGLIVTCLYQLNKSLTLLCTLHAIKCMPKNLSKPYWNAMESHLLTTNICRIPFRDYMFAKKVQSIKNGDHLKSFLGSVPGFDTLVSSMAQYPLVKKIIDWGEPLSQDMQKRVSLEPYEKYLLISEKTQEIDFPINSSSYFWFDPNKCSSELIDKAKEIRDNILEKLYKKCHPEVTDFSNVNFSLIQNFIHIGESDFFDILPFFSIEEIEKNKNFILIKAGKNLDYLLRIVSINIKMRKQALEFLLNAMEDRGGFCRNATELDRWKKALFPLLSIEGEKFLKAGDEKTLKNKIYDILQKSSWPLDRELYIYLQLTLEKKPPLDHFLQERFLQSIKETSLAMFYVGLTLFFKLLVSEIQWKGGE